MASAGEIKSHRLNNLLRKALGGATEVELRLHCRALGVTRNTENNYINAVMARIKRIKKKAF